MATNGTATRWLVWGGGLGLVAGIVFAMFEMIMAAVMGDGFIMPMRMIGAIPLGKAAALGPDANVMTAAIVGGITHMMLSIVYGVVFAAITLPIPALRRGTAVLVGAATVYGFLLWIVNFYLIAPGPFPWFGNANPVVQFFAHTFFYGSALGVLLAARRADAPAEGRTMGSAV